MHFIPQGTKGKEKFPNRGTVPNSKSSLGACELLGEAP